MDKKNNNEFYKTKKSDNYFTTDDTFKLISPYIPKNKKVIMPFYNKYSKCDELLKKYIDNKIIYENKNFFDLKFDKENDIIVDNPPFSNKKEIFKKINQDNVPFMLIVPIATLTYQYFKDLNKKNIQIIIFPKRQKFMKLLNESEVEAPSNPAFDCVCVCSQVNLKNDIIFL